EVQLRGWRQLRDLAAVGRRRLHVLGEREDVERNRAAGQPVADVEVDARLPLRDQRALVLLEERSAEPALDLLPEHGIAEDVPRVERGGIVRDREHAAEAP